jgi:hypothetical protein
MKLHRRANNIKEKILIRRRIMKIKNSMFLWLLILLALLTVTPALAVTVVTGKLDPYKDVPAVRAAVNEGGTVILRGHFHFGDNDKPYYGEGNYEGYSWVDILNSVKIVGKNATIHGGIGPLWVGAPESEVIIKGFDKNKRFTLVDARWAAIVVKDCGTIIIENVDVNGVNSFFYYDDELDLTLGERYGITAENWGPADTPPHHLIPLRIDKLSIVGCNINLGKYHDDTENGRGIFTWGIGTPDNEVDILIKGNTVRNCSLHGMGLFDIAGTLIVKGNYIRPGNKAFPYWGPDAANGIWALQTAGLGVIFDLPGGHEEYQSDWLSAVIRNNYIHCELNTFENDARALGILALRQVSSVIKNNNIRVDGGSFCIALGDGIDGFTVKRNICSGSGLVGAIGVEARAKNVKIMNNYFSAVTPTDAQVLIEEDANHISVIKNYLGPGGDSGGIYCAGFNNKFFYNTFHGSYPGWPDSGFLFLDEKSHDNLVVGLKKAMAPNGNDDCDNGGGDNGFDICTQVKDLGTNNKIIGYKKCLKHDDGDDE